MTMRIIRLSSSNVKRLVAVDIEPDGSLVIVGGRNGAGKSSVLDSIHMALGGKGAQPPEPIRKGERKAEVTIVLGQDGEPALKVVRTFTQNGAHLTVTDADGAKLKSPQGVINRLIGTIAFDPLAFTRLSAREQARNRAPRRRKGAA
jgi:DNA repair exonuclease SbcCD ATPase subunit